MAAPDDPRLQAAVRRAKAAQERGQQTLSYCNHPATSLGAIRTPISWQLFDVCVNPACREVVAGPYAYGGANKGLTIIGDTSTTPDVCSHLDCTRTDVELHHWGPRSIFPDAERWPTGQLCIGHHGIWHQCMRLGVKQVG